MVLARELSLDEVRAIRSQTDCELEMFVHGALCVSYSGQCFSSEAWGGRSANRGQCAQACRLPYELIVDQVLKPLGDARYLLSPGDLYALHQMPEIVQIGISALKIEGRYKDANYVALTTSAYRKAVDEAWAGRPLSISRAEELQLEQVYSRGLGAHFVTGTNHQTVVTGRSPGHRGVCVGQVTSVQQESVLIEPRPERGRCAAQAGRWRWCSMPPTGAAQRKKRKGVAYTRLQQRAAARSRCISATAQSTSAASGPATWSGAPTIRLWRRLSGHSPKPTRPCTNNR